MSNISRKLRRKQEKTKLKSSRKQIKEKLDVSNQMPDICVTCKKIFDITNKDMVDTWCMEVYQTPASVKLYCPKCWVEK